MQEPQWDVSPWCRRLLIKWIIGNWEHKGGGDKVIRPVTLPWWGDIITTSTGQMTWSPATRRYTPAKVKVGVTFNLNPKYLSVLSDVLLYDTRGESFVLQMVIWSYSGHPHLRSGHWYSISNFQTHLYFCSDAIKIDQQDFNTRLLSLRPMAPLSLCTLGKIRVYQKYLKLYSVFVSIGFHLTSGLTRRIRRRENQFLTVKA